MRNQRKTYIINPKFQYKFSFIICSLIFIGSLIYPITIYDIFEYIIQRFPTDSAEHNANRDSILLYLAIMQLAFTGFVFIFCIFISHKIVGPIYKLKLFLQNIRSTGELEHLKFRDGDHFQDLADEVNATLDYFASKTEEETQTLSELSLYLNNLTLVIPEDKRAVLEEAQKKIKEYLVVDK